MSIRGKLKQTAHWTSALATMAALQGEAKQIESDNVYRNALLEKVVRPTKEYLDYRVNRGALINGETQQERREKWQTIKKEKGVSAFFEAINNEEIKKMEIPSKDENGYLFETYEPGKKHVFESYYPNGVQQSKMEGDGDKAEGYYPDGSRKFSRTADGIETSYYPGGKKGEEKIKETPHRLYDAYDVLDEQGRRMEHHYDVTDSNKQISENSYLLKDIKKVDLYNPETQKLEATYTLDDWCIENGRVAQIGFVDNKGKMRTIDFPKTRGIGDNVYYAHSLDTDMIKEMYQNEMQERGQKILEQARLNKLKSER